MPKITDIRTPSVYHYHCKSYVKAGYQPRPCEPGTRKCEIPGWQNDVATVAVPFGNYGLGLRLGTVLPDGTILVVYDFDDDRLVTVAQALVPSPVGRIGSKGIALFARVAD